MVEKLYRMLMIFEANNNIKPNTIFIGYLDWEELCCENEALHYMKYSLDNQYTFCGIDIVRVDRQRYCKVGYVE